MAQFPMLPLWTDAYLADTTHLTTVQHGAYLRMLIAAWRDQHCRLPDNDKHLAKITGLSRSQWKDHSPTLRAFWRTEDGFLYQKRLSLERNRVEQRSQSASRAADARWLKTRDSTDADALPGQSEPVATIPRTKSISMSNTSNNNKNSNSEFVDSDWSGGNVIPPLRSETYEAARAAAPGWDVYALERIWREWCTGKEVRDADKAFLGFARKHAKENRL